MESMSAVALPSARIPEGFSNAQSRSVAKPEADKSVAAPIQEKAVEAPTKQSENGSGTTEGNVAAKPEDLAKAVEQVNQSVGKYTSLRFSVDEDLNKSVIKVMDKDTDKVVRQIPSDEMLDLAKHINSLKEGGGLLNVAA